MERRTPRRQEEGCWGNMLASCARWFRGSRSNGEQLGQAEEGWPNQEWAHPQNYNLLRTRDAAFLLLFLTICLLAIPATFLQILSFVSERRQHAVQEGDYMRLCLKDTVLSSPTGHTALGVMQLASTWAVARAYNLTPLVAERLARPIGAGFQPVGVSTVHEFLEEMPATDPGLCARRLQEDEVLRLDQLWRGMENVNELHRDGPVLLPAGLVVPHLIVPVVDELRRMLVFKPEFMELAQSILNDVEANMTMELDVTEEQIIYIGMHVKRSDFPMYLVEKWNITELVDEGYFARALEGMQLDLEDFADSGSNTTTNNTSCTATNSTNSSNTSSSARPFAYAVLISSDDMPWVDEVLIPYLYNDLEDREEQMVRVYGVGGGTDHDTFQDLAVLASCNHTVISFGMYGLLSAILAGGHTIAFDMRMPGYPTLEFAREMPYWSVMQ